MKDTREYAAAPLVSGQLLAFGPPAFSNPAAEVSTKPLIMLAYVRLEGHRSRLELSRLFWSHLAGQRTKKGERKDFNNYSVARAALKRVLGVDIEDAAQVTAFPCDVKAFIAAFHEGRLEDALRLYRRGSLLQGVEAQSRLKLSAEFLDWLDAKRAALACLAQEALLEIAQNPRYRGCAVRCAEETYRAERDSPNLGLLAQLHSLLSRLGSPLAFDARRRLEGRLNALLEEMSWASFRLYLALSLQDAPNLAAAQIALNLSPQAGAACVAELRHARLISAHNTVINSAVADFYFQRHTGEEMTLLRGLAESTPTEEAFIIFQTLFEKSHTFGGVGYWDKARAAYLDEARTLATLRDFEAAARVLEQLREAEVRNQQPPHPESQALWGYALEHLGY